MALPGAGTMMCSGLVFYFSQGTESEEIKYGILVESENFAHDLPPASGWPRSGPAMQHKYMIRSVSTERLS